MAWARFDDQYPDHPKIVAVGPVGMAFHTAATCYCARYLTDGFIPDAMIPRLLNLDGLFIICNGVSNAVTNEFVTDQLMRAGLLEKVDGGYLVHDYLEYNPPSDQVKAERKANKERIAAWRGKKGSNANSNAVTNPVVTGIPSPSPSPNPINANKGNEGGEVGEKSASAAFIPQTVEEKIYCAVTNHPTIPSGEVDAVLDCIAKIMRAKSYDTNGMIDYLRPFWKEAKLRYPGTSRTFWITEWAVVGEIPKPGGNGKNGKTNSRQNTMDILDQIISGGESGITN